MVETKENKKEKILAYINRESSSRDFEITALTIDSISEELGYSTSEVKECLSELEEEGAVAHKKIDVNLYVPKDKISGLPKRLKAYIGPQNWVYFFIGFSIILILIVYTNFVSWFTAHFGETQKDLFVSLILLGIFGTYFLGYLIYHAVETVISKTNISILNRSLIFTIIGIGGIAFITILIWSLVSGQEITITHILIVISIGLAGGPLYNKWVIHRT